jgi:uncharacterized protein (TIGR03083 family)
MDDDRQHDEASTVPREFDALLQIADRRDLPVTEGLATAALDRAFAQRRAGTWHGFVPDDDIDAGESYARAVRQFEGVLRGLTDREWRAPVATYGTVHDLVAHLLAIEIYTGKQIGLFADDAIDAPHDHVGLSDPWLARMRGADHRFVMTAWRDRTRQIVDALESDEDLLHGAASWHGAPIDVAALLVIRTFELWTHGDDVLVATERARHEPDNGQLKLMTNLAAEILPLGLEIIGRPHAGRTVRLVLTGRGGGTWRCPLAAGDTVTATDDVLVVADAVAFCRLAANRCRPADLDAYVEGDEALAVDLLAGMAALAAD